LPESYQLGAQIKELHDEIKVTNWLLAWHIAVKTDCSIAELLKRAKQEAT